MTEWTTEGFLSRTGNRDWFKLDVGGNKVGIVKREWLLNLLDGRKEAAPIKAPPEDGKR